MKIKEERYKGYLIEVYETEGKFRTEYDVEVDAGYFGTCFTMEQVNKSIALVKELVDKGEPILTI